MKTKTNYDRHAIDASHLGLIASFVATAKTLSFVEAAKVLGTSASTLSRKVSRLEEILGARLVERSTRALALTEAGRLYHSQCLEALQTLSKADAIVESLYSEPRGLLRISLPVALGRLHLTRPILTFLKLNPNVQIEVDYSDDFVNLIEGRYDAVVRIGSLPDSGLVARKIGENRRIVLASPEYLAEYGMPQNPTDLAQHKCLRYSHYASGGNIWRLQRGEALAEVRVNGEFHSNNSEALYQATLAGDGIAIVAEYMCYEDLRDGRLIPLLPDWTTVPSSAIYVVYPDRRWMAPKVRVFVTWLADLLRDPPWQNYTTAERPGLLS